MAEEGAAPSCKRKPRPTGRDGDGEDDVPLAKKKKEQQRETELMDLPDLPLEMIVGFVAEDGSSFSLANCCKRLSAMLPPKEIRVPNEMMMVLRRRGTDAFDILDAHGWHVIAENRCYFAAAAGNQPLLVSAREKGCPWNHYACYAAAERGDLPLMIYLHENGCTWYESTCECAARRGHLDLLKYLHENGCPWDVCTRWAAVKSPECMNYLDENDCPWSDPADPRPPEEEHLRLLHRMRANGCQWSKYMRRAAAKYPECLRYLDETGCP